MLMNERTVIYSAIITVALTLAVISGYSQEDIVFVKDPALSPEMRPPAKFAHDAHNEKAGIDECDACHHVFDEQNKQVENEDPGSMKCSECHGNEKGDTLPLINKYHQRCKGCHIEKKTGPVMCGECHVK